jgi:signal transduction histidine kinase
MKIHTQIEKAREQEREEFRKKSAADFHDEAGNKITKITLFTEMARSEIDNKLQLAGYLNKIQQNITELSLGMRDFLWVMDPQHDSLFETLSRLKDFGDSILTETGVQFTIHGMNAGFRSVVLPMNTRRDILQIFKEAINNCAKYASASEVTLTATVSDFIIEISLDDNGQGFDTNEEKNKNKYGLSIMHDRAKKIDADLKINSTKNKGTRISLKFNMPQMGNS